MHEIFWHSIGPAVNHFRCPVRQYSGASLIQCVPESTAPTTSGVSAVAYADDLTLICSDSSQQTAFQRMQSLLDLIKCSEWANNNQLCINVSKCFVMQIAANVR